MGFDRRRIRTSTLNPRRRRCLERLLGYANGLARALLT